MSTYDTLKKRRYVKKYDSNYHISHELMEEMLRQAWSVTPSKNNFMAYNVHVVGPDNPQIKQQVFLNCLSNERKLDGNENILEERYLDDLPNYANILNCSHLLIFTMRLETEPNPYQQFLIQRGHKYEAVDQRTLNDMLPTVSFETGLFADVFSALCLENDLDVSFTGCFRRDLESWKDIPFVTQRPVMIMTVGKSKQYLVKSTELPDPRPDFERIVNFVT